MNGAWSEDPSERRESVPSMTNRANCRTMRTIVAGRAGLGSECRVNGGSSMMTTVSSRVQIDDRAAATINAYPPEDQRRIRSAIGHLLGWDVLERLGERVRRLPTDEPLYIFRVPHGLRIVFSRERSREGDTITVIDVLRQETIDALAANAAARARGGEAGAESPQKSSPPAKSKRTAPRDKTPKGSRGGTREAGHSK
jgi:hypothetical protein